MKLLGDLCNLDSGFPFKSSDWVTTGIPVVKIKNVRDGSVNLDDCAFVSQEVASRASKFWAHEGDILVSLTGYVGEVGRVPRGVSVLVNQRVGLVRPKQKDELDLIFYLLRAFRSEIENLANGSAQANVSPLAIQSISIDNLSLIAVRRLLPLLKAIDEKIVINREVSSTLEQIAQTIFKSWFIDFEPVHAKSGGWQPEGMDAETAALFPDSFVETDFGLIPSTFEIARIDSFCDVQLGGTPSKANADYWDGSIPWINSGAVNEFRITRPSRNITELGLRKSSCKVLPKGTTVIAITGATLGQVSRVEIETTANQSVIGIVPKSSVHNNFVYLWVTQNVEQLAAKSTGGAQQHINRNDVCEQLVVLPSPEISSKFDELVGPIFLSISNLVFQNDNLIQIRDSLLPRLISGELEIPDELLVH